MKLFTAALALLAARFAAAEEASFTPETVEFGSLRTFKVERGLASLAEQGILAVSNVPGLAAARADALVAAAECVLTHGEAVAPVHVELQDASTRSSWAAYAKPGQREAVSPTSKCADLDAKMEKLRDAVDLGASYFARFLDGHFLAPELGLGLVDKADGGAYTTFEEMLGGTAQHLDHFHVYEKKEQEMQNNKMSLDLHTDHGVFIAIVPAVRVSQTHGLITVDKEEDSFMIETASGERAQVKLPTEGDVLVFMIGDGALNLKRAALSRPLRPVPHALALQSTAEGRSVRAWFGRMFFAPSDAVLNEKGETFASAIATVATARQLGQAFPTLGCAAGSQERRVLQDPSGHNCAAGTAYCWMTCLPMGNLDCSSQTAVCMSGKTGKVWTDCPTCHDPSAYLICPPFTLTTNSPTTTSAAAATVHTSFLANVMLMAAAWVLAAVMAI